MIIVYYVNNTFKVGRIFGESLFVPTLCLPPLFRVLRTIFFIDHDREFRSAAALAYSSLAQSILGIN